MLYVQLLLAVNNSLLLLWDGNFFYRLRANQQRVLMWYFFCKCYHKTISCILSHLGFKRWLMLQLSLCAISQHINIVPPPQKKCVVPILLLCNCPRQGDFFGKNCSICKNVLKNQKCALNLLCRVRQAGVYAKEWNMHIFLGTIF